MSSFPLYTQHDAMDCGPTCLRMVTAFYGRHFSLQYLRENCFISRQGVSMLGISEAAEKLGMQTIGKAKIPITGSGKVKIGQRINIQLDGYPYLEYGFVTGRIISVASMPDDDAYTATFELQNSQVTSYGKKIHQTGDLTGIGEIITDNLSVAERIIGPLKYLFYRNINN